MKPELLIPVGNPEALYAAVEGGADAVYFGLNKFSARARAKNFSLENIPAILSLTKKNNIKTYVTINTLIKNQELKTLIDIFHSLNYFGVDAVIIQDWGAYQILSKHFPKLEIHSSTQMGIHNSIGADFAKKKGFKRVILARDLTMPELRKIAKNTDIELEVFVHGSLCYSFSGYCLFSSYLGGMSANRGECRQPCRRKYSGNSKEEFLFSLKDLELIDLIPEFIELGISSLKIEGRMKAADYVLNTAKAYRLAIDSPDRIEEAKEILKNDTGREKTSYFFGKSIKNAVSQNSYAGILAGTVISSQKDNFTFKTHLDISEGNRLRIMPVSGDNTSMIKVRQILKMEKAESSSIVTIPFKDITVNKEDKVFLVGHGNIKFKSKLPDTRPGHIIGLSKKKKNIILDAVYEKTHIQQKEIYTKIDQLSWLPKIHLPLTDYLVISLTKNEWKLFLEKETFIDRFHKKIMVSLPVFINEENIKYYAELIEKLYKLGIKNFMIGHLSQLLLFKNRNNINIYGDENIYSLNDAAV
ncbi:MAG: U32 family peptidase, partial [Spirochaetes bacterium]|nr:U32 family peptidase [Spirochaetota bacterium]